MAAKSNDKFANKFYGTVTESAANTLTFKEIQTNVNLMDKTAWVLHKLEWYLTANTRAMLLAGDDVIQCALTSSDKLTALDLSAPGVIDLFEMQLHVSTAVAVNLLTMPVMRDFSQLPGGGIIVTPRPLFMALKGSSLASAGTVACRGYFTRIEMSAEDYLELVDFYRIIS